MVNSGPSTQSGCCGHCRVMVFLSVPTTACTVDTCAFESLHVCRYLCDTLMYNTWNSLSVWLKSCPKTNLNNFKLYTPLVLQSLLMNLSVLLVCPDCKSRKLELDITLWLTHVLCVFCRWAFVMKKHLSTHLLGKHGIGQRKERYV